MCVQRPGKHPRRVWPIFCPWLKRCLASSRSMRLTLQLKAASTRFLRAHTTCKFLYVLLHVDAYSCSTSIYLFCLSSLLNCV